MIKYFPLKRCLFLSGFLLLLLLQSCELPDPEEIRKNQYLPEKGFLPNTNLGKAKFEIHCIRCHGKNAQGSNNGPSLINKIYAPDHHADQAFRWAVKDGVKQHHWHFGDMPSIPEASPEDTAHIVLYVRQLQLQQQ